MKISAYRGRASLAHIYYDLLCLISNSWLIHSPLRLVLPALVCSCCSHSPETEILEVKSIQEIQDPAPIRSLDIFMFHDGEMMNLDAYQRIEETDRWEVQTASGKGDRRLFIIANGQWKRDDWMGVNSYQSLSGFKSDLENETSSYPAMTAECGLYADGTKTIWAEFRRLCSEVVLESVSCDFKGKNYEEITDLKAYLINVNGVCRLIDEDIVMPERIINMGGLNKGDLEKMKEPELLLRHLGSIKSGQNKITEFRFRCFPNNCPEESPGSPFTRLVLEGKIDGETCYWPINIGRNDSGSTSEGIIRNHRYIYNVTITGKGSASPDIPAYSETFLAKMEVEKWEEKEEYAIYY